LTLTTKKQATDARYPSDPRIAFLPMYDFEELHAAHDLFWAAIAIRLRPSLGGIVPSALARTTALMPTWRDPHLLLGQTCGYPLVTALNQMVRLVLTPVYDAPGCDGAWHRSAIVVRVDDDVTDLNGLRGRRCALNAWDSNTGMNLLRAAVAPIARGARFFRDITVTGSHRASLGLVAVGAADVASVDCVSLAHLTRIDPGLIERTRILDWSPASPALPMITAATTDQATLELLRTTLAEVFQDPTLAELRRTLLLESYEILPYETYETISHLEARAAANGYAQLA
jgi:ABC-type phosphate/phosphonate transport system substrate-binding protein